MAKNRNLDRGDVLPASWTDGIQEFISTLTSNLVVEMASATSIKIPASTGSGQVAIGIGGYWRYRSSDVSASLPSSDPGTYSIWVSAQDNSFSNSPSPDTDNTPYDFNLHVTTGAAPSGGVIVATRKIGQVDFNGTTITAIRLERNLVPLDPTRAPLASPALTGTPTVPTAAADTNTTQAASTAYVIGQGYLKSATAASTYAPIASPTLTGTPAGPTAAADTNTTQLATTAFVIGQGYLKAATAGSTYATIASPTFTGTVTIPTAAITTLTGAVDHTGNATALTQAVDNNSTRLATTAYVIGQGYLKSAAAASTYAPLASPTLTGTPAGPTAAVDTNTTQLATTAFVVGQGYLKSATAGSTYAPLAGPTFTGTVTIPTAAVTTFSGTPDFSGNATAQTQAVDNNSTRLATTAYVIGQGYLKSATAASTYAPLASPTLTGTPAAPTAAVDTNTTQLATTAYVVGQGYLKSATASSTYAPLASPTFTGVAAFPVGAVGTPSVYFTGDSNTGIYQGAGAADTLSVAVGGNNAATFGSSGSLAVAGNFAANGVTPAARQTYTVTGGSNDRAYTATSTSLDELANVVRTLIADLKNTGLIA